MSIISISTQTKPRLPNMKLILKTNDLLKTQINSDIERLQEKLADQNISLARILKTPAQLTIHNDLEVPTREIEFFAFSTIRGYWQLDKNTLSLYLSITSILEHLDVIPEDTDQETCIEIAKLSKPVGESIKNQFNVNQRKTRPVEIYITHRNLLVMNGHTLFKPAVTGRDNLRFKKSLEEEGDAELEGTPTYTPSLLRNNSRSRSPDLEGRISSPEQSKSAESSKRKGPRFTKVLKRPGRRSSTSSSSSNQGKKPTNKGRQVEFDDSTKQSIIDQTRSFFNKQASEAKDSTESSTKASKDTVDPSSNVHTVTDSEEEIDHIQLDEYQDYPHNDSLWKESRKQMDHERRTTDTLRKEEEIRNKQFEKVEEMMKRMEENQKILMDQLAIEKQKNQENSKAAEELGNVRKEMQVMRDCYQTHYLSCATGNQLPSPAPERMTSPMTPAQRSALAATLGPSGPESAQDIQNRLPLPFSPPVVPNNDSNMAAHQPTPPEDNSSEVTPDPQGSSTSTPKTSTNPFEEPEEPSLKDKEYTRKVLERSRKNKNNPLTSDSEEDLFFDTSEPEVDKDMAESLALLDNQETVNQFLSKANQWMEVVRKTEASVATAGAAKNLNIIKNTLLVLIWKIFSKEHALSFEMNCILHQLAREAYQNWKRLNQHLKTQNQKAKFTQQRKKILNKTKWEDDQEQDDDI